MDVAVARRNDPGGDGPAETERIANGDDPFTEPQFVAVAEFYRLQRLGRIDLEQREVGLLIAADNFGLQSRAVIEDDIDLVGVGNDVIVGDDEAGRVDNEA